VLINCAGVIFAGDLESSYPQDYDHLMDVNLRTPFVLTQFFVEFLRQSKGVVINLSCDKGSRPEAGMIGYCMTKAGLEMMTKSTAMELACFGIRVNGVASSFVDTNFYRYAGLSEPELEALQKRAVSNIPMQRAGTEYEVAKAVIFMTSEHA
jgi:glucose 1-dehydrogenase